MMYYLISPYLTRNNAFIKIKSAQLHVVTQFDTFVQNSMHRILGRSSCTTLIMHAGGTCGAQQASKRRNLGTIRRTMEVEEPSHKVLAKS